MLELFICYVIWNVLVFLIYGLDKLFAKIRFIRISERFLLTIAFAMGAIGARLGMKIFHHKTRHNNFRKLVPFFVAINVTIVLIVFIVVFFI